MDINSQIRNVLEHYRTLQYDSESNHIKGELFVTKSDSYDILIDLSPYPDFFPIVYETSGRIPSKLDRHVYGDTGSCCFTTRAKSQILLKTKISSLIIFIQEIVKPYFLNNSFYEINHRYKTEEYSHDYLGIIEGYKDILQIDNDLVLARTIFNRAEGKKLKIYDDCYCGSRVKLKKCSKGLHNNCYNDFKKIDRNVLIQDLGSHFEKHLSNIGVLKTRSK